MKHFILFIAIVLFGNILLAQQLTYVPDDNFENYLETHDPTGNVVPVGDPNSMGNGIANDDSVYTSRISNVTSLSVPALNITDLTGIEDFQSLEELYCFLNQLTALDVTQNTALQSLDCSNNQLSSLDVSQNTVLLYLYCGNNQLTALDVTNTALQGLGCAFNQLTSLDVTQNTALQILRCYDNQLTSLNVLQNTALQNLDCSNNQLTSLNVSQNTALQSLDCSNNQLTSLDVTQNISLEDLSCSVNQLTTLDVTQNTALTTLLLSGNQLTTLDMRNGNDTNLIYFDATGSPNLTCVFVDDSSYMHNYWPNAIDASATYVETQAQCDALGVDEYLAGLILVYPNPFTNVVTIQIQNGAGIKNINIQNLQGKIVYQKGYIPQVNLSELPINLSELPTGIYFLTVETAKGYTYPYKLVKQ